MPASVGVIVPVHGPLTPVLDLLEQLVGPTVPAADKPGRVIIVDDASPTPVDAAALPEHVELIRRERNGGFGAAVNTGLAALASAPAHGPGSAQRPVTAQGADTAPGIEFALVLNSDLRVPAGFVRDLLAQVAPWQPVVAGCRAADENGRSGYSARRFPTIGHQVVEWLVPLASQRHRSVLHRAVGHDLTAEHATQVTPVDWVSGAALLLPLAPVRAVGGFDEGFFMYTEEVDLQLRLREIGIGSVFVPALTVIHEGGGSSGNEARRRRWLVGARMRYAHKHGHVHVLRAAMTAATGVNLAWNTGRRLAGRDVQPLAVAREELALIYRAGADLPRV